MNHSRLAAFAIVLVTTALLGATRPAQAFDLSSLWPVAGSGRIVTEGRGASDFTALSIDTAASVEVVQGQRESVQVEADDNVAPLINVYVDNHVLVVEDDKHYKATKARVVITVRRLSGLMVSGSTAVLAQGLVSPRLSIDATGAASLKLQSLTAEVLDAGASGSAALKVNGIVNSLRATLGGSAVLGASELEARSVSVTAGGSAAASVWAKESLRLALGGSSAVRYRGDPQLTSTVGASASVARAASTPAK